LYTDANATDAAEPNNRFAVTVSSCHRARLGSQKVAAQAEGMPGKAGRSHPLGLKNQWFGFDVADSARILPTALLAPTSSSM
jgi:hypothetical protein